MIHRDAEIILYLLCKRIVKSTLAWFLDSLHNKNEMQTTMFAFQSKLAFPFDQRTSECLCMCRYRTVLQTHQPIVTVIGTCVPQYETYHLHKCMYFFVTRLYMCVYVNVYSNKHLYERVVWLLSNFGECCEMIVVLHLFALIPKQILLWLLFTDLMIGAWNKYLK